MHDLPVYRQDLGAQQADKPRTKQITVEVWSCTSLERAKFAWSESDLRSHATRDMEICQLATYRVIQTLFLILSRQKIFWYFMHMRGKTICEFSAAVSEKKTLWGTGPAGWEMGGRSSRLQVEDPRCCNVRPRSSAYGYPYCPHGSNRFLGVEFSEN